MQVIKIVKTHRAALSFVNIGGKKERCSEENFLLHI